jgi:hypothetical protein
MKALARKFNAQTKAKVKETSNGRGVGWSLQNKGVSLADSFIFGYLDGVKWSEFVKQFNVS